MLTRDYLNSFQKLLNFELISLLVIFLHKLYHTISMYVQNNLSINYIHFSSSLIDSIFNMFGHLFIIWSLLPVPLRWVCKQHRKKIYCTYSLVTFIYCAHTTSVVRIPNIGKMNTGRRAVTARGSTSVHQYDPIKIIT